MCGSIKVLLSCDMMSHKQWLMCLSRSMQKHPVFDHPHHTTGTLHPAERWTPSCSSGNCRIFRNILLGHDTDSWKTFQQNFNFEAILWLLLISTWRIRRSLWQLYRFKRQAFSIMVTFERKLKVTTVALLMHQNWWYNMFAVGLQMVLDKGWAHLVTELFPLSNISRNHIFMSSKGYSTEVGMSAKHGGMSKLLAWVRQNHITEI